ncbi:MAG: hypothetical protein R6W70_01930 [bacterium]
MSGRVIKSEKYSEKEVKPFHLASHDEVSVEKKKNTKTSGVEKPPETMEEAGKNVKELFESIKKEKEKPDFSEVKGFDEFVENIDLGGGRGRVSEKKVLELEKKTEENRDVIKKKNMEIKLLKEKIEELRKNKKTQGFKQGVEDGMKKGLADSKKRVDESIEEMGKNINKELKRIKKESEGRWEKIRDIIIASVVKIAGDSFAEEHAVEVIRNVKSVFPDEDRIVLKVSPQLFNVFKDTERENIKIIKDRNGDKFSIFAEAKDAVVDFSFETQIKNIKNWLDGVDDE